MSCYVYAMVYIDEQCGCTTIERVNIENTYYNESFNLKLFGSLDDLKNIFTNSIGEALEKLFNTITLKRIGDNDILIKFIIIHPERKYPIGMIYSSEDDEIHYGYINSDWCMTTIDDIDMENDYGSYTQLNIWDNSILDLKSIIKRHLEYHFNLYQEDNNDANR